MRIFLTRLAFLGSPHGGGGGDGGGGGGASLVFECGLECGALGGSAGDHIWSGGSGVTVVSDGARSGAACLRAYGNNYNLSSTNDINSVPAGAMFVARLYVKFTTRPEPGTYFFWVGDGAARLGLFYHSAENKIYAAKDHGSPTLGAVGIAVSTGVWYRIDVRIDQTSGAKSLEFTVDDVAGTTITSTDAAAPTKMRLGSTNDVFTVTGEWRIDDIAVSTTSGDFPIGDTGASGEVP